MKFPFYLASLVSSYELPRFDVLDEYSRHTTANNYTLSTKGCPCFYDNSRKEGMIFKYQRLFYKWHEDYI